jgi:hydroxyacylglutathione hydrolase
MFLRTLYDEKLAQASYLVGCQTTGEALVVDPNRDVEQYVRLAKREGLRITHVTETHIHADFVSGTRELAHRCGATMYLSNEGAPDWCYAFAESSHAVLLTDGDSFNVGNIRIDVVHTPGHTPEHICFLVTDTRSARQPMGIFTGDFVFVGDVGRPDLLEKAAGVAGTMRAGARDLYRSLQRFRELPDYLQVWPGHGAGSACGKALGAVPQSTVGYEKLFSPALSFTNEDEFVDYILAGQPEPPRYFSQMKRINRDGPVILGDLHAAKPLEPGTIADLLDRGIPVIDTRHNVAFSRGHIPGTINIPFNRAFTGWAGWLIPYDTDFALIIDDRTAPHAVADIPRDLALIGLDRIAGYFNSEAVEWWRTHRGSIETMDALRTADVESMLRLDDVFVLDVRSRGEWEAGHIPGVLNIPVGHVAERSDELPRDRLIVVHCQTGSRSAIAASVLKARGFQVANVHGGYDEWAASGRPVESERAGVGA